MKAKVKAVKKRPAPKIVKVPVEEIQSVHDTISDLYERLKKWYRGKP